MDFQRLASIVAFLALYAKRPVLTARAPFADNSAMTALSPTPALRDLIAPAAPWLETVRERMRAIVPPEGELLMVALDQSLGADGKLLRPLLTLLCALATLPPGSSPNEGHLETAAAAELIHIATLLHDDVLDDADLRRGRPTVRASFGNRVAILAGDYLLAQASRKLAAVGDIRVVSLFSDVLAALCDGEVEQIRASYSVSASDWDSYRRKTIGKTASLFAACCEARRISMGFAPTTPLRCARLASRWESPSRSWMICSTLRPANPNWASR